MISDREDKKMARFLPLLKKKQKKIQVLQKLQNQQPMKQNKNNLTQELRSEDRKKIEDRKKALEERRIK
jgi:hypothetical protein